MLGRIREKLRTYGLRSYEPGEGVRVIDLEEKWGELERGEKRWVGKVRRDAKEKVGRIAEAAEGELKALQRGLGAVTGPLEVSREWVSSWEIEKVLS